MSYRLFIQSGPLQGRSFPIQDGSVIGRSSADISINDPKMSGRHAKFVLGTDGEITLMDLGSTNGLQVGGKKLTQVVLYPGLIVKIGGTLFQIQGEGPPAQPEPSLQPPSPPIIRPKQTKVWSDFLADFSLKATKNVRENLTELLPFNPLLVLTVTRGIQSGEVWHFGYGPRQIGLSSLDFHIFDESAPPLTFTVTPQGSLAKFSTDFPDQVRLNGHSVSAELLKSGDEICLFSSTIKVSYKE